MQNVNTHTVARLSFFARLSAWIIRTRMSSFACLCTLLFTHTFTLAKCVYLLVHLCIALSSCSKLNEHVHLVCRLLKEDGQK